MRLRDNRTHTRLSSQVEIYFEFAIEVGDGHHHFDGQRHGGVGGLMKKKIYKFQPSKLLLDFLLSLDRSSSNGLQEIGHLFFLYTSLSLSPIYLTDHRSSPSPHQKKEEEKFQKISSCVYVEKR